MIKGTDETGKTPLTIIQVLPHYTQGSDGGAYHIAYTQNEFRLVAHPFAPETIILERSHFCSLCIIALSNSMSTP